MGPIVAILPGVLPAVSLSPRMRPLVGATLIALGGPGAGQSRVVTGTVPGGYSIDRPFDDWLVPGETMVAAQPSVGRKLVVGNRFEGTSVVQASRWVALN